MTHHDDGDVIHNDGAGLVIHNCTMGDGRKVDIVMNGDNLALRPIDTTGSNGPKDTPNVPPVPARVTTVEELDALPVGRTLWGCAGTWEARTDDHPRGRVRRLVVELLEEPRGHDRAHHRPGHRTGRVVRGEEEPTRRRAPASDPEQEDCPMSDTLRDRIAVLADGYDAPGGDEGWPLASRRVAATLRAVLAETTATQPEADAVEDVDRRLRWLEVAAPTPWTVRVVADGLPSNGPGGHVVADANGMTLVQTDYDEYGYHLAHLLAQAPDLYRARAALAAVQPVEPETDDREALVDAILSAWRNRQPVLTPRAAAERDADAILAAGFRRTRPDDVHVHRAILNARLDGYEEGRAEATHTVTAEQRLTLARHMLAVRVGVPHVAFYESEDSRMWHEGIALADMALAALGVTVTDTPSRPTWTGLFGIDPEYDEEGGAS